MVSRGRLNPKVIQSRANPAYKAVRGLKVGFDGEQILLEGEKLIREVLALGYQPTAIWTDQDPGLPCEGQLYRIPTKLYEAISPTKAGQRPLAVLSSPKLLETTSEKLQQGRYLLLDRIQEPGNAGALVRAAAAFGLDGVIWRRPCVYPFHHACIRASAGTVFRLEHLEVHENQNLPGDLYFIGSGLPGARSLKDFHWPESFILVMGHEGQGVDPSLLPALKASVNIPMSKGVESLNVAGAAHILLHAASESR